MNKLSTINELNKLGCTDNSKCALTCQVVRDLQNTGINVKEKKFLKELGFIYLIGTDANNKSKLYVPVSSWEDISLFDVDEVQTKLCHNSNMELEFVLAVCDTSGTVLYYSMKSGWPSGGSSTF